MQLSFSSCRVRNQKHKNRGQARSERPGFVDEQGQIFLPPSGAKQLVQWFEKCAIEPALQAAYRTSNV